MPKFSGMQLHSKWNWIFIYVCIYMFCDLQIRHRHSFHSLNWSLSYWSLLWTFLLRTTFFLVNQRQGILAQGKEYFLQGYHSPSSAGILSPGLLKDLPGRSNCELPFTVSQPEGKGSHSNCVENPIRAKCATPLFFPYPSLAQLCVSCLKAERRRPSRAATAEGQCNSFCCFAKELRETFS